MIALWISAALVSAVAVAVAEARALFRDRPDELRRIEQAELGPQ